MKTQFLLSLLLCAASAANGAQLINLTVDTSTISGTTGSIDFQFNPGPFTTQAATAQILSFAGATYVSGTQSQFGGATGGPLPATVTIANSAADNEDFEGIKFGTSLGFTLSFDGPAITSPNGSLSTSTFALSLFSDASGTIPVLTSDPNGVLATVQLNRNSGALITQVVSPNAQFGPAVPEPGSLLLVGGALVALAARAYKGMKKVPASQL
jgi:hypothetical protein